MNNDAGQHCLQIARAALIEALGGPPAPPHPDPQPLYECGGVFVTLWQGEYLRGCIGTFAPDGPLAATIASVARQATRDPRFIDSPLSLDDLAAVSVEVSLLSVPQRTHSPADLTVGLHGVLIRRDQASGCFLPQVAAERGWSAVEVLTHCCTHKANLPPDAWLDPATEVFLFTAETFGDRCAPATPGEPRSAADSSGRAAGAAGP